MQKTFMLCESKATSEITDEIGVKELIAAIILAPSIEEAAKIIGGELEEKEDELIVWLPLSQFREVWNGVEYDAEALASLSDGKHPCDKYESFDAEIWFCPGHEKLRLDNIQFVANKNRTKKGLAICEIPLITGDSVLKEK